MCEYESQLAEQKVKVIKQQSKIVQTEQLGTIVELKQCHI